MNKPKRQHQNKLWMDKQFEWLTQHPCFWCDKMLTRVLATADHLVPQYLGKEWENDRVISCNKCNGERSLISSLAVILKTQEKWSKRNKRKWTDQRLKIRPLLHKFRDLIYQKVTDDGIKSICLDEINMVIRTQPMKFKEEE
ncbi:hypothetical protein C4577_05140 [Candidatus Parcubacteria bacterium]|nr:MAG: hypothetical protein C4577_05140 [Candidatus Parcubacteria bacterium]